MTRPPVEVRRACSEDLDDLVVLWAGAREELGGKARAGGVPELLRTRLVEALRSAEVHLLIARHEGVPAGIAALRTASVLTVDGSVLQIDTLYVVPELRRRGVARALLVASTAIAERAGAEQVVAGAPPAARDSHRFLARLGFSPLVVRRVVATATLRRRLAGEGQRRGLEDLLSRRRSLRARGLRSTWSGAPDVTDELPALDELDDVVLNDGPPCDDGLRHVDLSQLPAQLPAQGTGEPADVPDPAPRLTT